MKDFESPLTGKSTPSSKAWLRRAAAALYGLALAAAALSLTACSGPAGSGSGAASSSGVQFYGTIDTGVGYQHTSH